MTPESVLRMPDFCGRSYPFHYEEALVTLRKLGMDLGTVRLLAVGESANYRGEVLEQDPAPGTEITPHTQVTLHVGRWSGVDELPYQLFFGWRGAQTDTEAWELDARHLMAPTDAALARREALDTNEFHRIHIGVVDRSHLARFFDLFSFSPQEEFEKIEEWLFWASVMPSHHEWAGNADRVAAASSHLVGYPVEIVESVRSEFIIPDEDQSTLGSGSCQLGATSIMGRRFSECDSTFELDVHDVEPEKMHLFLPGGRGRRRLEWLVRALMPSHLACRVRVRTDGRKPPVGKDHRACYLGYSTCL